MTIDRGELVAVAHAERQRLGRTVQFADPSTWSQPSAAAGWWNVDVMAHLAAGDTAAAQLVAGEPATELEEYRGELGDERFTVEGWNAWHVARRSGLPEREILDTWGKAAESFLVYCARLTDEEWREDRYTWFAGDIATRYLIQSRVVEWFLHGEDMRATNGVADGWQRQWQHWPVHLTIDMGVRMLPWALARAGHELSGKSVQIDVEGAGEGSWHWGLGSGEVPRPTQKPDALLLGRAPQFALVAGQRLSPDAVLESGTVVLGGDTALADLILRTIRAYP
ncbi:MAG: maleylpyruvate isomerase family mycothiol-dependent enzyme [Actinomycetota bacterium]